MKLNRILPALLALALLAGCGGKKAAPARTPEEFASAYSQAITAARDDELNGAYPITADMKDDMAEAIFMVMGLNKEDVTAFAASVSLMNVQAYNVSVFMPAEGKTEDVKKALESYVEGMQRSFEFYLEDQYAVTKAARVEILSDGAVALVMCEGQDGVLESIKKSAGV